MPEFIADQIRVHHEWGKPKPREVSAQPSSVVRIDPRRVEEVIRMLGVAFPWHQTAEGEAFWFDVVKRLQRVQDRGR